VIRSRVLAYYFRFFQEEFWELLYFKGGLGCFPNFFNGSNEYFKLFKNSFLIVDRSICPISLFNLILYEILLNLNRFMIN
jgi:hypothetical protein